MRAFVPIRPRFLQGFTLLELMVTVAIAALLAALAAPSVKDMIVRNGLSNIGNEFTGSLTRARNEATSKNMCVSVCLSTTADQARPTCSTSARDWQVGWIAFLNPTCNSDLNAPLDGTPAVYTDANLLFARSTGNSNYSLSPPDGADAIREVIFNPLGRANDNGTFEIRYSGSDATRLNSNFAYNVCLSKMGRTRRWKASDGCN